MGLCRPSGVRVTELDLVPQCLVCLVCLCYHSVVYERGRVLSSLSRREGRPLSWVSGGSGNGRYSLRSPSADAVAGKGAPGGMDVSLFSLWRDTTWHNR